MGEGRRGAWAPWLVLVLACGTADEESLATYDGYWRALRHAVCAKGASCGTVEPALCEESLAYHLPAYDGVSATGVAVREGRLRYDPLAARTCLDAYAAVDCARYLDGGAFEPACEWVVVADQVVGEMCSGEDECVKSRCQLPEGCDPRQMCCAGQCVASADREPELGEACTFGCRPPAGCIAGVCALPTAAGQACSNYCPPPLTCNRNAGGCEPFVARPVDGQPCRDDVDRPCADDHVCDAQRVCRLAPALGQPCDTRCRQQAICVDATCVPAAREGEPCDEEIRCLAGSDACRAGVCTVAQPDGEACGFDGFCRSRRCLEGVCAPPPTCE
jgi:hypothetical protein